MSANISGVETGLWRSHGHLLRSFLLPVWFCYLIKRNACTHRQISMACVSFEVSFGSCENDIWSGRNIRWMERKLMPAIVVCAYNDDVGLESGVECTVCRTWTKTRHFCWKQYMLFVLSSAIVRNLMKIFPAAMWLLPSWPLLPGLEPQFRSCWSRLLTCSNSLKIHCIGIRNVLILYMQCAYVGSIQNSDVLRYSWHTKVNW